MAQAKLRMRLGDLMVHESIITEQQLTQALQAQRSGGRKLGATLIDLGHLTEEQLLQFLSQQLNIPFIDLQDLRLDPKIAQLLPEVHARRHRALVVQDKGQSLLVAMSDPADLSAQDALAMLLSKPIELAVVKEAQLLEAYDQLYRRTAEIASFANQLGEEYSQTEDFSLGGDGDEEGESSTVARLLQSIFEDAVQVRASDVHLEPDENALRIRQRVDGLLQENILEESRIAAALVLRLKLMGGLDISEKRLPQDGRFNIKVRGHSIDVRVSTMPVQHGESVVMRLLDQSAGLLSMEQTGLPDDLLRRLRHQLKRPHGMILVTGPTGSGKTTTLYGALSELNEPGKKIITVEDPVEYRLPRINQVQVNSKIGLSFSQILRTTLRQDPDIIMVGEMRDHETVEIGLRGALTGHLVLTTLHTNDAVTSALRLIDMGAAGYLVASALRAVVAQRLVRRICDNCGKPHALNDSEKVWLEGLSGFSLTDKVFHKGVGCQSCNYTGYRGRIGVFELLELDDAMMAALRQSDPQQFALAAKRSKGFKPLAEAALDYAFAGITTVDEVLRLAEHVEHIPEAVKVTADAVEG
ncbi:GspE/PulE family protein [Corallincola spongiicola]|uniref:Type II/IV secretion system protein n=1 Tax=Corallincola spongiicola TaxID=2520508 RepID=A0ABY1WNR9_9GAMM|nr:GspE/PulE family protein [Corallincola spongiicola]TAA45198.1 type II/IV secretion system protein [Corallincola spongiicola]